MRRSLCGISHEQCDSHRAHAARHGRDGANDAFRFGESNIAAELSRLFVIVYADVDDRLPGAEIRRADALAPPGSGATVTLCHSKTENAAGLAREADILIAAAGRRESVGAAYFRAGQTVIDVGIHYNEETQKLCGDVALAEADGVVRAVTPVPGGVGALTTAVLAAHTAKAAARRIK